MQSLLESAWDPSRRDKKRLLLALRKKQSVYCGNMRRIREIYNELSSASGFLDRTLADEAIIRLLDGRLNVAMARACLSLLNLHTWDPYVGLQIQSTGLLPMRSTPTSGDDPDKILRVAVEPTPDETNVAFLDWQWYRSSLSWSKDIQEAFEMYRHITHIRLLFILSYVLCLESVDGVSPAFVVGLRRKLEVFWTVSR